MKLTREKKRKWLSTCVVALVLLFSFQASADARAEYLINMLENGSSYRIKVQAANTLGKIRCNESVPALVRALSDEHELVVISAATSLGQIGDISAIPKIKEALGTAPSDAARSQIEMTLRILKSLTSDGDTTEAEAAKPRFLIRIDAMGNSSGVQRDDITDVMRNIVIKALRREPGVVIQEPGLKPKQIKKKLKKEKLKGFILSGSILKMEQDGDQMIVKLSLNVFSNPEYNLLMMPSAEGNVPVINGPLTRETEYGAHEKALRAVVDALVSNIFDTLATSSE